MHILHGRAYKLIYPKFVCDNKCGNNLATINEDDQILDDKNGKYGVKLK